MRTGSRSGAAELAGAGGAGGTGDTASASGLDLAVADLGDDCGGGGFGG